MADPITLGTLGMVASGASAGVGAIGSIMGGNANSAAYKYKAGMASIAEKVALQNAEMARAEGEVGASQAGMRYGQLAGKIKANQGASGVDVNSGSSVDVQKSQNLVARMDQRMIRQNAARKAYGFEVEAAGAKAEGAQATMASGNAKTAGLIGAFGSILGGVSSVSSKWLQGKTLGMWGDTGDQTLGGEYAYPGAHT